MTIYQTKQKGKITAAITAYANAHGKTLDTIEAIHIVDYLHRMEKTIDRLSTAKVNGELDETEKLRLKKIGNKALNYVKENIGCEAYISYCPGAMQIRLYIKDKSTDYFFNSFDGETTGFEW